MRDQSTTGRRYAAPAAQYLRQSAEAERQMLKLKTALLEGGAVQSAPDEFVLVGVGFAELERRMLANAVSSLG